MFTVTHGAVAYGLNGLLNKFRKNKRSPVCLVLGAFAPDIGFFLNFISGHDFHTLTMISRAAHSILVFLGILMVSLLLGFYRSPKFRSFLVGWSLFHIVIDCITHTEPQPYLWPFKLGISGLVDHVKMPWIAVDIVVAAIWLIYLWLKPKTP